MHLKRAISASQCHTPVTVANYLYFLVTGGLNVELNKYVLVVTYPRGFNFSQNFTDQLGSPCSLTEPENSLAFASAATDGL